MRLPFAEIGKMEDQIWELEIRKLALVMLSLEHVLNFQVELVSKQEKI